MGKSSTSCFNIITCGGNDGVREDECVSDSVKVSTTDKRRWSFRKKSSTHRILTNTLASDTSQSLLFKNSETSDFHDETVCSAEEKISVSTDRKSSPPAYVESKTVKIEQVADDASEAVDENIEDYFAVVAESSIRVLLAQEEMENMKSVVKLQAVVRGHMVRRQAVGALRCVLAIVKIQALVRKRQLSPLLQPKRNVRSTSLERLLANRFARQLLDSEPGEKPVVHFRCDPSNRGSAAWLWLRRWMSASPSPYQYRAGEKGESWVGPAASAHGPERPFTFLENPGSGASNPAFVAARSKFEELSMAAGSHKPAFQEDGSPEKEAGGAERKAAGGGSDTAGTPEGRGGGGSGRLQRGNSGKGKRVRGEGDDYEEESSSSSMPSYMQSTESARARVAQAAGSPRSSPDGGGGGDGDLLLRKRHSLPGVGMSPRSWRSVSHAPRLKGRGNPSCAHHRHERSWQR